MKIEWVFEPEPGKEHVVIHLTAETEREIYDVGRITGLLEVLGMPGGEFRDDGLPAVTLTLLDRRGKDGK